MPLLPIPRSHTTINGRIEEIWDQAYYMLPQIKSRYYKLFLFLSYINKL